MYEETVKPNKLSDSDVPLYYMYSNSHDTLGETYQEITNEEVLEIAYKVYKEK
jgi:hypothetical protein